MKNHYNLNISTENCFVPGWDVEAFLNSDEIEPYICHDAKPINCYIMIPIERIFNREWIDNLEKTLPDPVLNKVCIFMRMANTREYGAHLDLQEMNGQTMCVPFALNFSSIENDPTDMMWYENPPNVFEYAKARRNHMDRDELVEIDRCKIPHDKLCLIRADVIHDVEIPTQNRYAYSIRTMGAGFRPWEETIKLYEPLFV